MGDLLSMCNAFPCNAAYDHGPLHRASHCMQCYTPPDLTVFPGHLHLRLLFGQTPRHRSLMPDSVKIVHKGVTHDFPVDLLCTLGDLKELLLVRLLDNPPDVQVKVSAFPSVFSVGPGVHDSSGTDGRRHSHLCVGAGRGRGRRLVEPLARGRWLKVLVAFPVALRLSLTPPNVRSEGRPQLLTVPWPHDGARAWGTRTCWGLGGRGVEGVEVARGRRCLWQGSPSLTGDGVCQWARRATWLRRARHVLCDGCGQSRAPRARSLWGMGVKRGLPRFGGEGRILVPLPFPRTRP